MSKVIIRPGTDPKHSYVGKCSNCGTLFRYNWSDTKDNQISSWHEHHVICPTCGYEVGFQEVPVRTMIFPCDSEKLFFCKSAALIPEGCRAYILYQNGVGIKAVEVDKIIPANVASLIVGSCTQVEILPGIISMYEGIPIRLQELPGDGSQGYYRVSGDDIVKIRKDSNEIFGIPSSVDHLFIDFINL